MTLLTLLQYLFGFREAILRLARCRQALGLGLLLVIVAGLAREYDGEDLLAEPWHVLVPLAASVVSSSVLYLLVRGVAWGQGASEPPLTRGYLDFLGLYWLTAPLALVYAIPVERMLPPAPATAANLWLLGLVSVWRVLLMARVVAVLYGRGFWTGFFLVMFFADTVTAIVVGMMELPIVGVMGGIRLSPEESVLHDTVWTIRVLSVLTWPVWFVAAWVVAGLPILWPGLKGPNWEYQPAATAPLVGARPHVRAAAGGLLAGFLALLPLTQPAQQLRTQVERDLRVGRISEALSAMSARERGDFPPHWDPPPRITYRERAPDIVAVMEVLDVQPTAPWVRAIYTEKFSNFLRGEDSFGGLWRELPPAEAERIIGLIERLPERSKLVRDHEDGLETQVGQYSEWPLELQSRVSKLMVEAGIKLPEAAGGGANENEQQLPGDN